ASLPHRVGHLFEMAAGGMLIVLGIDVLRRLRHTRAHFHAHEHADGVRHFHVHTHGVETPHAHDPHHHMHGMHPRALLVGSIHGMAGSAALTVLSLHALRSFRAAMAYALVFGIGSIAGMIAFTVVLSFSLQRWLQGLGRFA